MLKRISRKLITLSVLVVTLAAVSFVPASSKNRQRFCFDGPITAECGCGNYCCDLSGYCTCMC